MLHVPYYRPKVCIWSKTVYKVNLQAGTLFEEKTTLGIGGGCHLNQKVSLKNLIYMTLDNVSNLHFIIFKSIMNRLMVFNSDPQYIT